MITDFNEEKEIKLLDFIQSNYGLEVFTPGLERTSALFCRYVDMARAQSVKTTVIAGTNGKGQTAHTLCYLLETAQLSTSLWTSPHILSLRERFHVDGLDLSYEELEIELHKTHNFLKKNHSTLHISFYEFLFLVFLRIVFSPDKKRPIQHLILEVGLGGRLDAVNHFDADCACITSISRDHQSILGSRFDQILNEKIAVSRREKPLFTQFKLQYLNQLTAKYCDSHGIDWRPLPVVSDNNYFEENQKMAIEIFSTYLPQNDIPPQSSLPNFKGRREEMTFNGNTLIFIGAHNIDGIRRMIELFSPQTGQNWPDVVLLSFSKRSSNELEVMLKMLLDFFGNKSKVVITGFVHPKALELNEVARLENKFNKINKGLLDFVTDWKAEVSLFKNQKILVCGSYYFVGEVQRYIISNI
ncbi:MAG: hypothetical protein WC635_18005 [Bacteriovorax sp.]|jgi:dihydrofolate synthase/folylpolyglutamate synthase